MAALVKLEILEPLEDTENLAIVWSGSAPGGNKVFESYYGYKSVGHKIRRGRMCYQDVTARLKEPLMQTN